MSQDQTAALKSESYSILDPDKIVDTVAKLEMRIGDRFPDAGLRKVCRQLLAISREARRRTIEISRPIRPLRTATVILVIIFGIGLVATVALLPTSDEVVTKRRFLELVEWTLQDIAFIGIGIIFLWTYEVRLKRKKALAAIHELRSIAHIIDMHQLTKDPDPAVHPGHDTEASPKRTLDKWELARYLDYCSEMLSLVGKIAALYVQRFDDSASLAAVNEVESLTTGLSRKIWQKVMILDVDEARDRGVS